MNDCQHPLVKRRIHGLHPVRAPYWACVDCGRTFQPAPTLTEILQKRRGAPPIGYEGGDGTVRLNNGKSFKAEWRTPDSGKDD